MYRVSKVIDEASYTPFWPQLTRLGLDGQVSFARLVHDRKFFTGRKFQGRRRGNRRSSETRFDLVSNRVRSALERDCYQLSRATLEWQPYGLGRAPRKEGRRERPRIRCRYRLNSSSHSRSSSRVCTGGEQACRQTYAVGPSRASRSAHSGGTSDRPRMSTHSARPDSPGGL